MVIRNVRETTMNKYPSKKIDFAQKFMDMVRKLLVSKNQKASIFFNE